MCGIAGSVACGPARRRFVHGDCLAHRGPEDSGHFETQVGDCRVSLSHWRLRIVDLSEAGHQPLTRGPLTVVFNGEIYNFRDLRRSLEKDGYRFSSSCDTEVILQTFDRWGLESIPKLRGMFAFALWNDQSRELLLARDRLGKKPLFYSYDGRSFIFGSEIKAILTAMDRTPEIDHEALDDYLTYLYVPYPRTMFRGIWQLPPGAWLRVKAGENDLIMQSGSYWSPMAGKSMEHASADDQRDQLQELVGDAVRSRLISDVPLGVLLSGGMDSSTITAMMARASAEPVRSFSIGFAGNSAYDEVPFAKTVATYFGCEHKVLQAEPASSRHLAKIIWHFDQPFGNPTAVLAYVLSALTKKSVTVALAGDGGDELFGGYPRYIGAYVSNIPRALPAFLRSRLLPWIGSAIADNVDGHHQFRRLREFLEGCGRPLIEMYLGWIGYFSTMEKAELYSPSFAARIGEHDSGDFIRGLYAECEGLEPLNRLAYVDMKSFLCCNVLEYADRMSMAHALELRAPLTDHRLAEFSLRLPFNLKFRYGQSKWLLKEAMKPFLPSEVLSRRKLGFNPPVGAWLEGELHGLPEVLLSSRRVLQRGLFRPDAVARMLEAHYGGRRDYSLKIWALMMLEIWFRMYIDGASVEEAQNEIDSAIGAPSQATAASIH